MKVNQIFRKFAEEMGVINEAKGFVGYEHDWDGCFNLALLNENGVEVKSHHSWAEMTEWMFKNLKFEYRERKTSIKDNPAQHIKEVLEGKKDSIRLFLMDEMQMFIKNIDFHILNDEYIVFSVITAHNEDNFTMWLKYGVKENSFRFYRVEHFDASFSKKLLKKLNG